MKLRVFLALVLMSVVAGLGWNYRGALRSTIREGQKPILPNEQTYQLIASTSSVPAVTSSSTDPLAWNGTLPKSVNLAVPFLSQAPKMNWSMPYQEACEEASLLMVDGYYRGRTKVFSSDEGDRAILDLVAFEEKIGKGPDINAQEVADVMKRKFGYKRVLVRPLTNVGQIKAALANGYPVIIPVDGKAIGNPHFRNGGPVYHMLVIKGYVGDRYWITNDPGTRFGKDYTYQMRHLTNVIHDWNDGNVRRGKPFMIVALPNEGI